MACHKKNAEANARPNKKEVRMVSVERRLAGRRGGCWAAMVIGSSQEISTIRGIMIMGIGWGKKPNQAFFSAPLQHILNIF